MIISITGTPGTGKTTLAEKLAEKLEYNLIRVNDFARERGFTLGIDASRESEIIDVEKLGKVKIDDNTIIEGHLSHFMNSDIIIVLRCDPEELYQRLKKRDYSIEKIRENLESECMGGVLTESLSRNNNVYEVDTTNKSVSETLEDLMEIIKGKRNKYKPKINYLEKIMDLDNIIKR